MSSLRRPFWLCALSLLLLATMACAARPEDRNASTEGTGLLTASPESFRLATEPLAAMTAALRAGEEYRNVHALLIAKGRTARLRGVFRG